MADRYQPTHRVGYRSPPVHSRFKPGQSGNPRGRRRERPTVAAIVAEELQATLYIAENGERRKTNKLRLLFKQAINQAIAGNFRPLVLAMQISDALQRMNETPTRKNPRRHPYADIDTSKLSLDELQKLLREAIDNLKPLSEYRS